MNVSYSYCSKCSSPVANCSCEWRRKDPTLPFCLCCNFLPDLSVWVPVHSSGLVLSVPSASWQTVLVTMLSGSFIRVEGCVYSVEQWCRRMVCWFTQSIMKRDGLHAGSCLDKEVAWDSGRQVNAGMMQHTSYARKLVSSCGHHRECENQKERRTKPQ